MLAAASRKARLTLAGKSIDPDSEAADLYLSNQEACLLLQLPGELRSIIYSYVLGGNKTIYVAYKPHEWKRRKVDGLVKWGHAVQGGFYCSVWPSGTNPFNATWMNRNSKPGPKLESKGFTLLSQVCRQLYMETATLPMSENTWAFANYYVMNRYLIKEKRLSLAQRRAIKTVLISSPATINKSIVKHLGNLQTIMVNGETIYRMNTKSKPTVKKKPITGEKNPSFALWIAQDFYEVV